MTDKTNPFIQDDNTIDVVSPSTLEFYEEFFQPNPNTLKLVTSSLCIGEILFELGLIDSKSWARKNGWWKPAESGFHQISFGKNKIQIYLFITMRQV